MSEGLTLGARAVQSDLFAAPVEPPRVERTGPAPLAEPDAPLRGPGWRAPGVDEHICRHPGCGGAAGFSDDHGRTWFDLAHRPAGFLPRDRADDRTGGRA